MAGTRAHRGTFEGAADLAPPGVRLLSQHRFDAPIYYTWQLFADPERLRCGIRARSPGASLERLAGDLKRAGK